MERAILQAANRPCKGPARTWFLCKAWCLGLSLNQGMCVNQGFGKGHIEKGFEKGNI
jgi:hypothetical protein